MYVSVYLLCISHVFRPCTLNEISAPRGDALGLPCRNAVYVYFSVPYPSVMLLPMLWLVWLEFPASDE